MGVGVLSLLMLDLSSQEPSHPLRGSCTGSSMEDTSKEGTSKEGTSKDSTGNTTTSNTTSAILNTRNKDMVITNKGMGNSNFIIPALHPSSNISPNHSKYPLLPRDRQPQIQILLYQHLLQSRQRSPHLHL